MDLSVWWAWGILGLIFLTTLMTLISCFLLHQRRNFQPLKFRAPGLVLISGLGGQAVSIWLFVYLLLQSGASYENEISSWWCKTWQWVAPIGYTLLLAPYGLRFYRVVKIFKSTSTGQIVSAKYWDKVVVSESNLFRILAILVLIVIGLCVGFQLSGLSLDMTGYNCSEYNYTNWIAFLVFNLCEVLGCLVVIFVLRRSPDQFFMVKELEVTSVLWFVCTLGTMIALVAVNGTVPLGPNIVNEYWFFNTNAMLMIVKNFGSFVVSGAWPLYLSRSPVDFVPLWSSTDALRSLDTVLRDMVCMEYFRQFLLAEGVLEYILCWIEIEIFKDYCETQEDIDGHLTEDALRIYDRYLRDNTEFEVPVSDGARKAIERVLVDQEELLTSQVFLPAQNELYNLMNAYFPSFLCSDSCRTCLEELEKEEALKLILARSDMI